MPPLLTFDPAKIAFGDNPAEWRLPTTQGLTWRHAVRDDIPRLHEIWEEMDRKFGGKQDRPNLFKMPVLLVLVAVDNVTGVIDSAAYAECVADWTMIGTSRRASRTIDKLHPYLAMFLFGTPIRVTRILIPKRLEKHMARMMPQMRNITHSFAQFVCNIR